ncbi:MAG TPA: NADH:flavin oxidoreductase [Verrucomicrobiae bacterium]|nr:NADH:flavin oxidoreductase [Verrucomicrobiae bacterium]
MPEAHIGLVRIPSLKTVAEFRRRLAELNITIPCDDEVLTRENSPLAKPAPGVFINGKTIGNRIAVQPMEGWDGTAEGGITPEVLRRWTRFGESGAKLICGGEAMAVRPDGRANPRQLIISRQHAAELEQLRDALVKAHEERYGTAGDLVVGFQLTHSGRFCRPHGKTLEPRIAYRHPLLDKKFNITSDNAVITDAELKELVQGYVAAAGVAWDCGADFVDIKHCHGYLLHEFLSAFNRPGEYGGSFENRTRLLREIIQGIRESGNKIEIAVRLSAFDLVPFKPDASRARPGRLGPGIPEDVPLPYRFAFGCDVDNPTAYDLTEPRKFVRLCAELGVKIINITAGSPYYNPHIQRPAAYPPSDGYQPAHDPLIDVARQMEVARLLKSAAPSGMLFVGSAYSYLQEFLPHVAQAAVRDGWTDFAGVGRLILSYPTMLAEAMNGGLQTPKRLCRTFSDCTTAPRKGMVSGCYPLDPFYSGRAEAKALKEIKASALK